LAGVLGRGLTLAGIGLLAGLVFAAVGGRWVEGLLFDVKPRDPVTYAGVAVTLAAVALVACALPAWRGTRVDPADALRRE
jgi:putative ABC transport system permease protein